VEALRVAAKSVLRLSLIACAELRFSLNDQGLASADRRVIHARFAALASKIVAFLPWARLIFEKPCLDLAAFVSAI
jgi:hypothetical protein